MILIKTKLGRGIHGIGLFAAEFIPKGTKTWQYFPEFDIAFTEEQINRMSPCSREQVLHYAYYDKGLDRYILCFDDQRFINHSSHSANIHSTPEMDVAARDIKEGEELLCDYYKFDDDYFSRRGIRREDLL